MVDEAYEVEEQEEEVKEAEPKIMCFVSKQMVPVSETVEVEYAPRKKVHVLPKYIKFVEASAEA